MSNNLVISLYKKVVSEYINIRESDLYDRLLAMNDTKTLIYINLGGLEPFFKCRVIRF